jgi:ubiquinone/menaquinone biosynthesis C-methylase UbiE
MTYSKWRDIEHVQCYVDQRYKKWDQRWLDYREQKIIKSFFEEFSLRGTILDIPSGCGRFTELLSTYGETHAADGAYLPLLFQLKRGKYQAVTSCNCLVEQLPYADSSFDIVNSIRLIQHIRTRKERIEIFKELNRVCRGWMIISFYVLAPIHQLHRSIVRKKANITSLKSDELLDELNESGLSVVKLVAVLPGLHAHRIALLKSQ